MVRNLTALVLCLVAGAAWAYPSELTCKSTVYEPFVIDSSQGIRGIDVDVVREMGRRLGIHIRIKLMPWRRLEKRLEEGQESCVFAYFRTPDRLRFARFMGIPLHVTRYTLFGPPKLVDRIHDIADLKGMRVGVNRGFRLPEKFAKGLKAGLFGLTQVSDDSVSFRMLSLGRLDLVLTNADVGTYVSHHLHDLSVGQVSPPLTIRPAYLVLARRPEFAQLIQRFDGVLWQILTDGTYRRICRKYLPDCEGHQ